MSKRPIGTCRLCGAQKVPLCESHIVPAFAHRLAHQGAKQFVVLANGTARLSNKAIKEYLLGRCCEERFCAIEAAIRPMLAHDDESPLPWLRDVHVGGRVGISKSKNNELIMRFAASVVWRAAVAKDPGNSLGRYEAAFREYLLDPTKSFPLDAYLLVSLVTGKVQGMSVQRNSSPPKQERLGAAQQHWFICCGAMFHLVVGKTVPSSVSRRCFVRTNGLVALDAQELMGRPLVELLGKNRRVGKWAKQSP